MQTWLEDVRYAVRMLVKQPGFAATSVLTLLIGILLNTAAFGLVNALWFGKLPFSNEREIAVVYSTKAGVGRAGLSWAEYESLNSARPSFPQTAAFSSRMLSVAVGAGDPEQVRGGVMTSSTLPLLGIAPLLGRGFTASEDGSYQEASGPPVVLISEGWWRSRTGADPKIVGRIVHVNGSPATVVGVLPHTFRFVYSGYQLIAPMSRNVIRSAPDARALEVLARVPERAAADLLSNRLQFHLPASSDGWTLHAAPYRSTVFREARRMFPVLLAGTLLLLLIVCANLSNLLLARTAARRREIAVRLALGAGRMRIVGHVLAEGMVIALVSAALSLAAAFALQHLVIAHVPELHAFRLDMHVFVWTLTIAVVAGLAFALAPALYASRESVSETMKSACAVNNRAGGRLRSVTVVVQIAVAFTLLTGTGLLVHSLAGIRYVDTGLDLDGVLTTELRPAGARYAEPEARMRVMQAVAEQVRRLPGVEAAGLTSNPPLQVVPEAVVLEVEGRAARPDRDTVNMVRTYADATFLRAVRIPIIAGRDLTPVEYARSSDVALVNESLARMIAEDPLRAIGRRLRAGATGEWLTVVGITRDAQQLLTLPPAPELITSAANGPATAMTLVVRSSALQADTAARQIRTEMRRTAPELAPGRFNTREDIVEMFLPRAMIAGLGVFSAGALGLAAIGLYGVVSFLTVRRTHEIGIRKALGACNSAIFAEVIGGSLRLTGLGLLGGVAGAFAVSQLLSAIFPGLVSLHPAVFAIVPLTLVAVAFAATLLPATVAARQDPAVALRHE